MARIPDKRTDHAGYLRYHNGKHILRELEEMKLRVERAVQDEPDGVRKQLYEDAAKWVDQAHGTFRLGWVNDQPFHTEKK